jgi:hypothetical protein
VPLKDLRFRCTKCRSRLTDSVVMSWDALNGSALAYTTAAKTRKPCLWPHRRYPSSPKPWKSGMRFWSLSRTVAK